MVFVDQPKEEGEKKDCLNCDKPMIARLKTYKDPQYKPKIQWQETDDTKAHYDKDGNCVRSPEKQTAPVPEPIAPDSPPQFAKLPELDGEMKSIVEGDTLILYQTRNTVEEFLKKFESDPHGGMVGQFTEIIYNKHFKVNFKKGSEV